MRATLTRTLVLEILSHFGQLRDVLRAIVAVAGWYHVADAADGTWLYAPAPDAPGLPLDEAALTIVAECRRFLAREKAGQQAEQTGGEVHAPTIGRDNATVELGDA